MGFLNQVPVLIIALLLGSCAASAASVLPPELLVSGPGDVILGFDLRQDTAPTASLLMVQNDSVPKAGSIVWLPFKSEAIGVGGSLVGGVGEYETHTLVTLASASTVSGRFTLDMVPVFSPYPENLLDLRALRGNLYLVREGLRRTFLYRLNTLHQRSAWLANNRLWSDVCELDAIAIALPDGAEGREIADGKTAIPEMLQEIGGIRFFPAASAVPGIDFLQVRYAVLPSSRASALAKTSAKVFGSLLVPLFTLILIPGDANKHPRLRRIAIPALVALQILIVAYFVWIGLSTGVGSVVGAIEDIVPAILGAIAQIAVLAVKRDRSADEFRMTA